MKRRRVDVAKFVVPEAVDRDEKVPWKERAHPEEVEDEVDSVEAVPWRRFKGFLRQQEIYRESKLLLCYNLCFYVCT